MGLRYGPTTSAPIPLPLTGSALPGGNRYAARDSAGSPLTLNNSFSVYRRSDKSTIGRTSHLLDELPNNIYDAFGSPPDPQTFGAVALDRAGRPLYISLGGPVANGPYDIDLTRNAPHAVRSALRPTIPSAWRNWNASSVVTIATQPRFRNAWSNLTSSGGTFHFAVAAGGIHHRKLVGPCASGVLPPALRASLLPEHQMRSVAAPRRYPHGQVAGKGHSYQTTLNTMRMQLLPWEILQGLQDGPQPALRGRRVLGSQQQRAT